MSACKKCDGTGVPPGRAVCTDCGGTGEARHCEHPDCDLIHGDGYSDAARAMAQAEEMAGRNLAKAKLETVPYRKPRPGTHAALRHVGNKTKRVAS